MFLQVGVLHGESGSWSQTGVGLMFSAGTPSARLPLCGNEANGVERKVKPEAVGWKTKCAAETVEDKVACGAFSLWCILRKEKYLVCTGELYGMLPRAVHRMARHHRAVSEMPQ